MKLTASERAAMREVYAYEFDRYEAMLMMGAPLADVLARKASDDARGAVLSEPESGVFATVTAVDDLGEAKVG